MLEKLYTIEETAKYFNVSTNAVYNWIGAGKIRTVKTPGDLKRIPESEIKRFSEFKED